MAILKCGTTLTDFVTGATVHSDSTATTGRPPSVAEAIQLLSQNRADALEVAGGIASTPDLWVSAFVRTGQTSSGLELLVMRDAANDRDLWRIATTGTNLIYTLQYYDGASWTTQATLPAITNAITRWDIRIKIDATAGELEVWHDKVSVYSATGIDTLHNTSTGFDSVLFMRPTSSTGGTATAYVSSVVITDENTLSMRYVQNAINANGALQDITGGFSNVTGSGYQEGSFIVSASPGDRSTYATPAIATTYTDGAEVLAVNVSGRARRDASGPASARLVIYSNGDVATGPDQVLLESFENINGFFSTVNPNTGLAWTIAEMNAAQVGIEHRAA